MIYLDTLMDVNQHNREYDEGKHSWFKEINQFADITEEELIAQYTGLRLPANIEEQRAAGPISYYKGKPGVPDELDYRDQGAVNAVKNQGSCGSCWAFATTAALEGRAFLKSGSLPDCAEQQLVSCSGEEYDTYGCNGGWYDGAWKYIRDNKENGIDTQTSYPYTARDDACNTSKTQDGQDVASTCQGPGYVDKNEAAIKEEVGTNGPLAIATSVTGWGSYSGGVFDDPSCTAACMHAITIVGYSESQKYWIVRNSWGSSWGDHGYILLRKDANMQYGMCGLAQYAYYPIA